MNKQVSVIIPNYNYARFLQRRIDCIVNQTIKPAEIIFLDDCSTDNSLDVATEILSKIDIPYQIIHNETNQGVFKQWLKGIELVQHDYFWIAEADDYCELNLLETLLPAFDDEDVVISYCQSLKVGSGGMENTHKNWLSSVIDAHRWNSNYVNNNYDEADKYLIVISCIANASAVLLKKSSINNSWVSLITQYKMAGDWFFYLLLLFNNPTKKISYNAAVLNYWYQHCNSVWANKDREFQGATECLKIFSYCLSNFNISRSSKQQIFNMLNSYYLNIKSSDQLYPYKVLEVVELLGADIVYDVLKELVLNRIEINYQITRLHGECAVRDSEINRLHGECANRDGEINRLGIDLLNMNNQLLTMDNNLSNEKHEVSRLHSEVNLRDIEIGRLHNHVGSIYATLSWKITKPLRLLKKGVTIIVFMLRQLVSRTKRLVKRVIIKVTKKIATINIIKRVVKSYLNKHPKLKMKIKRKMIEKGLLHDPRLNLTTLSPKIDMAADDPVEQVRQQYGNDIANVYQILTKKK